ncbi:MAG TPA: replication protein [Terriglobales bacterium]|nr:replication protein [Terriglobales bacterium]
MQDDSPQLENGYTRLANELLDAILAFPFSARQLKVVMTIIRKTYGYNKKRDDISASQIGAACGLARNHVTTILGELAAINVIRKESGQFGLILELNKRFSEWIEPDSPKSGLVPNRDTLSGKGTTTNSDADESVHHELSSPNSGLVPNKDADSPESGQVDSPNLGHTKDNLPKDNQQKERAQKNPEFEEVWRLYPKRDGGNSKADALKAWNARVKAGVAPSEMLAGLKRYIAYLERKGDIGTPYVKQAVTFFGKSAHYAEAWGQKMEGDAEWWKAAGFDREWKATNAGCTRSNAHQWRDGQRIEG